MSISLQYPDVVKGSDIEASFWNPSRTVHYLMGHMAVEDLTLSRDQLQTGWIRLHLALDSWLKWQG